MTSPVRAQTAANRSYFLMQMLKGIRSSTSTTLDKQQENIKQSKIGKKVRHCQKISIVRVFKWNKGIYDNKNLQLCPIELRNFQ